jgi:hypothetical protein
MCVMCIGVCVRGIKYLVCICVYVYVCVCVYIYIVCMCMFSDVCGYSVAAFAFLCFPARDMIARLRAYALMYAVFFQICVCSMYVHVYVV